MSVHRITIEISDSSLDACWHRDGYDGTTLAEHLPECNSDLGFFRWLSRASNYYGFHFDSIKLEKVED